MNSHAIAHCDDLKEGEQIVAISNGKVLYRGQVEDRMPDQNIFWIFEASHGTRKMLAFADFDIMRGSDPSQDASTRNFTHSPVHGHCFTERKGDSH